MMILCSSPWLRLFSHSAPAQVLTAGTILAFVYSDPLCRFPSAHRSAQPSPSLSCWELRQCRAFCSDSSYCDHFLLGSDYISSFISVCYVGTCVCMFEHVCVRMCVICNTHACTVTWGQQRASDPLELSWRLWSPFLPFLFLFLVLLGVILGLLFFKLSVLNLKISSTYIMLNFLFIITLTPLFYSPPSATEPSLLDKTLSPLLLPLPNRNDRKLWAPGHLSSAT